MAITFAGTSYALADSRQNGIGALSTGSGAKSSQLGYGEVK